MIKKRKRFLIIDCNSVIHRAFHALPLLTDSKGRAINAVYGFFSVLIRNVKEIEPSCIIGAFDLPEPTFRHKKFEGYKAKRLPTPDDLINQFPIVKEGLVAFGVSVLEKKGFEADDVIGSVAKIVSDRNLGSSVIISGDKDNLQLVSQNTDVFLLKKGIKDFAVYNPAKVGEDYGGIKPSQLIDLKALQGDNSDNIPGIPGIGEKTASALIKSFGTLEGIYEEVKNEGVENNQSGISPSLKLKLEKNKEGAFLSRELVTIRTDIDFDIDLDKLRWNGLDNSNGIDFLKEVGFDTLIKRIKTTKEEVKKKNLSLF